MLDSLLRDVQHTWRSLGRAPGFAACAVLMLAVALAASTTLVSLFNAVVLRPLPVNEPERLAVLSLADSRTGQLRFIYQDTFDALKARQRSFDLLTLYSGGGALLGEAHGSAIDGGVESVTPEYFEMLGVRPFAGRLITAAETADPTGAPVIMISHRYWLRQFGGDAAAIGQVLKVENVPLTIVGILPPGFYGVQATGGADLFVTAPTLRPISGDRTRPLRARNVVGRLRSGVTIDQARAELASLWPALREVPVRTLPAAEQADIASASASLESLSRGFSSMRQRYAEPLAVLVGLTALVLVATCINVSALLLVRAAARHREIVVRRALGASGARLVQQLLVESLLLALGAAIVAVPLGLWGSTVAGSVLSSGSLLPPVGAVTPDVRVLAAVATLTIASAVLISTLPALVVASERGAIALRTATSIGQRRARAPRLLLVVQIAVSFVLVVSAGLLARSLAEIRDNGRDLPARNLVWARLWLKPGERGATFDRTYFASLAQDLSAVPAAQSVAFSMTFPTFFALQPPTDSVAVSDAPDSVPAATAMTELISPGFFRTIGIGLVRGRDFSWDDDVRGQPVAILSASLAAALFPSGDAVGRHVRPGRDASAPVLLVVAVAADAPIGNLREAHVRALFRPMLQQLGRARVPVAHIRVSGDASRALSSFGPVAAAHSHHFVRSAYILEDHVDQSLLQERMLAWLSWGFAGLALLLAIIGVHGALAYGVVRRTGEIGVRMALGATRASVIRAIVREAIVLAAAGVVIGIPAALAAAPLLRSQLFGLKPNDPATFAVAAAVFLVIGIVSGARPALTAATIAPVEALRRE